jgi:DNA-binding HxlR family transcriptional regulator
VASGAELRVVEYSLTDEGRSPAPVLQALYD